MKLSAQGQLKLAAKLAFAAGAGLVLGQAHAAAPADAPASGASAPEANLKVAQAGATATTATTTGTGTPVQLQGVEVTGSRIKQPTLTSSAALQSINDTELQFEGTVNVDSLLANLPSASITSSTAVSTQSSVATVNLRNLGPGRTLVLIDGKRVVPGDPQGGPAANLNFIPAALVERTDVLTGGASAVYGSDAISGVVNFIMKKDFDGFAIDGQWGRTDSGDATNYNVNLIWGSNYAGGDGNVTLYAGYTRFDELKQDARDFSVSNFAPSKDGTKLIPLGSGTIPDARFVSYDQPAGSSPYRILDPNGSRTFVADDGRTFNFNPFNLLQRPEKRYTLGGFAHRSFNEHADVYGSAMFMTDSLNNQFAPGGTFFNNFTINCDNPLVSAQQRQFLCPNPGQTEANVAIGKRTVEFGPRQEDLRNTEYRIVFGLRGAIVKGWSYDVSVQRGETTLTQDTLNDVSTKQTQQALQVTTDSSGNPVCIDPSGGCVPLDLFQLGALTQAQKNFVSLPELRQGNTVEEVASASITGDLGQYDVGSPFARRGIQFAAGSEYRRETLDFRPDQINQVDNQIFPVSGRFNVRDYFGELQLPIAENLPFVKSLQFDTAYRLSNYKIATRSSELFTHTYKFGLRYNPIQDVGFRASWNRAVRAPDINELFFPSSVQVFGGTDPCAGPTPTATLAQCERSGVAPAQFGNIAQCSANQCNVRLGGNRNLDAEKAITRQAGIVLTPRFLKGFTATIDYYNIIVSNAIGTLPPQTILNECLQNNQFCNQIQRGVNGQLFGGPENFISTNNINTGLIKERGVDFDLNYSRYLMDLGLGDNGRVDFNFIGTYLNAFERKNTPTSPEFNCAGFFGQVCSNVSPGDIGSPLPRWRHKARLTWINPMGAVPGFALSLQWRYFGETSLDSNNTNNSQLNPAQRTFDRIDAKLPTKNYLDLAMTYRLPIPTQDVTLRFGINNLGAEGPPIVGDTAIPALNSSSNANTFPNVFDTLGRQFFLGISANFR
ncbi:MAG: TonB-dependent receptor [Gammaproteobacteria bacterium]|nr:TonB-dependent receptor [Gammaproteobacteria bacterium]